MAKKPNIKRKISKVNRTVYNSRSIKYIVVHYVGAVSTAANNASYFLQHLQGSISTLLYRRHFNLAGGRG